SAPSATSATTAPSSGSRPSTPTRICPPPSATPPPCTSPASPSSTRPTAPPPNNSGRPAARPADTPGHMAIRRPNRAEHDERPPHSGRPLVQGDDRIRTDVQGFAGLCLTTRPHHRRRVDGSTPTLDACQPFVSLHPLE